MHESMRRLFDLAASGRKVPAVTGDSALGLALNESPQTIYNWKKRGVSEGGAIKAAELFGGNAAELLGRPVETSTLAPAGVAQKMSHIELSLLPPLIWEDVVELARADELPDHFFVEMPDDALAPRLLKGEKIGFRKASKMDRAFPRNVCLISVEGRLYVRRIGQDEQERQIAVALDDAFPSFRTFKVEAVMFMRAADSI